MAPRKRNQKAQAPQPDPRRAVTRSRHAAFEQQEAQNQLALVAAARARDARLAQRREQRAAARQQAIHEEAARIEEASRQAEMLEAARIEAVRIEQAARQAAQEEEEARQKQREADGLEAMRQEAARRVEAARLHDAAQREAERRRKAEAAQKAAELRQAAVAAERDARQEAEATAPIQPTHDAQERNQSPHRAAALAAAENRRRQEAELAITAGSPSIKGKKRQRSDTPEAPISQPPRQRRRLRDPEPSAGGSNLTQLPSSETAPSHTTTTPHSAPIPSTTRVAIEPQPQSVESAFSNYQACLLEESRVRAMAGSNFDANSEAVLKVIRRDELDALGRAIQHEAWAEEQRLPARSMRDLHNPRITDPGTNVLQALQNARAIAAFRAAIYRNSNPLSQLSNAAGLERLQARLREAFRTLAEALDHHHGLNPDPSTARNHAARPQASDGNESATSGSATAEGRTRRQGAPRASQQPPSRQEETRRAPASSVTSQDTRRKRKRSDRQGQEGTAVAQTESDDPDRVEIFIATSAPPRTRRKLYDEATQEPRASSSTALTSTPRIAGPRAEQRAEEEIEEIQTEGVRTGDIAEEEEEEEHAPLAVDTAMRNYQTHRLYERNVGLLGGHADILKELAARRAAEFEALAGALQQEARDIEQMLPPRNFAGIVPPDLRDAGPDVRLALQQARNAASYRAAMHRNMTHAERLQHAEMMNRISEVERSWFSALATALESDHNASSSETPEESEEQEDSTGEDQGEHEEAEAEVEEPGAGLFLPDDLRGGYGVVDDDDNNTGEMAPRAGTSRLPTEPEIYGTVGDYKGGWLEIRRYPAAAEDDQEHIEEETETEEEGPGQTSNQSQPGSSFSFEVRRRDDDDAPPPGPPTFRGR